MFTFSFQWLQILSAHPLDLSESLAILNKQGLEVQRVEKRTEDNNKEDVLVTIEVKANRPDCLSHLGVLRELYFDHGWDFSPLLRHQQKELATVPKKNNFSLILTVDQTLCSRFAAQALCRLDNRVVLPDAISGPLTRLGFASINPIVDILNYVTLLMGQPMHAYDAQKIAQASLQVTASKQPLDFVTLNGTTLKLPANAILVSSGNTPLALAGIIGGDHARVTADTTEIILESANFNPVAIRVVAKGLRISTPASFRFERGVDVHQTVDAMQLAVSLLLQHCGGEMASTLYDYNPQPKGLTQIPLDVQKTNQLLGAQLSAVQMAELLTQYDNQVTIDPTQRVLTVTVPTYRLDVLHEIDLVEEVGRIYGYERIAPTLPVVQMDPPLHPLWDHRNRMRDLLVALGFYEVINYSFIPKYYREIFSIPVDANSAEVLLKNPLSQEYALMRPNLLYSLMHTMAYNYSMGHKNLSLCELGRRYLRDSSTDTGYREEEVVAGVMTGIRMERGFGIEKDVYYTFHDLLNYLHILLHDFNQLYMLEAESLPFFETGSGFFIYASDSPDSSLNKKILGFCGQIAEKHWQKIENGKLVRDPAFYFEINLELLTRKSRTIQFAGLFPAVVREYNFLVPDSQSVQAVSQTIQQSDALIVAVTLKDVYQGKGVSAGHKSLLFEVRYEAADRTLTIAEVAGVEQKFLVALQQQGVNFKN